MLENSCPQYIPASQDSGARIHDLSGHEDLDSSICTSLSSNFHANSASPELSISNPVTETSSSAHKTEEAQTVGTLQLGASVSALPHEAHAVRSVFSNESYHPCHETSRQLGSLPRGAEGRVEQLAKAVRTILECVGEDPGREGLRATPERYAKAMLYFTKGYSESVHDLLNGAVFYETYDGIIIVRDIDIVSLCEHHITPFTGKMHIGYIPNGRVLGLSKLARLAEMFSRRLQLQERLTEQVAMAIHDALKPRGVGVIMESSHLCMVMRGVQKVGSTTTTSYMVGSLRSNAKTREEFLALLRQK